MPNIALVLKQEVSRLARKEIRGQTGPLRKALAQYRRGMAALKRSMAELERRIASLEKRTTGSAARVAADSAAGARFSPKWLSAHRKRLGLSAAEYGKLLGVTGWSVYGWEHGKTRPRKQQLAAMVAIRGLGKREIKARLKSAAK